MPHHRRSTLWLGQQAGMLHCAAGEHKQYLVRATYLEIYQEEVRDLLSKNPNQRLEVKESADKGVYVKGLVQFVVKSVAEINSVLQVMCNCMHATPYCSMQPQACVRLLMSSTAPCIWQQDKQSSAHPESFV